MHLGGLPVLQCLRERVRVSRHLVGEALHDLTGERDTLETRDVTQVAARRAGGWVERAGCAAAHVLQQLPRRGEERAEVLERGKTSATKLVSQLQHERNRKGTDPPVRVRSSSGGSCGGGGWGLAVVCTVCGV